MYQCVTVEEVGLAPPTHPPVTYLAASSRTFSNLFI